MVGVTPMLGRNDDGSVFDQDDARQLVAFARQQHLGGLGFWEETRAALARVPLDAVVEPAPEQSGRDYTTSRVILSSFEGRRIRAWYTLPKDNPRGRFSAIMAVPGYGGEKPIPFHLAIELTGTPPAWVKDPPAIRSPSKTVSTMAW